ncbi:MAG: hypothetical protein VX794_04700 [Nitrospinota bacterium]|nr:hypothetical protein [Nitrospinota bacterium]
MDPEEEITERPPYILGTPEELDAVAAAPSNHEVLIENEKVRVVRVTIEPGELEKMHTHKYHSVFIVSSLPEINYYDEKMRKVKLPGRRQAGVPRYLEPEGVHAVENVGDKLFDGIRIELKEKTY